MASKHKKKSWVSGQVRAGRVLAAITIDGRKSGLASFVLGQMCGRGGVADVVGTIHRRVCKASTSRRCMRRIEKRGI